jgi:hypothetical protein
MAAESPPAPPLQTPAPQPPARQPDGRQARPAQPPAVGDAAPDIPLFDGQGKESSLREVLKDKIVVLVFYIGYT